VPGAAANCFRLAGATPPPPLPEGALLFNAQLGGGAAADGRPLLRETEGYHVWDVGSSVHFHVQTAHVPSGRLAIVQQLHGHASLVLVSRMGGSWAPSHEVTILIRGC
jgi:hypothetical protein